MSLLFLKYSLKKPFTYDLLTLKKRLVETVTKSSIDKWIKFLSTSSSRLRKFLAWICGENPEAMEAKRLMYLKAAEKFKNAFDSEGEVIFARAPGRVNLMGRHMDFMGGYVNPIATEAEIFVFAQARDDDWVYLRNMNPCYEPNCFQITQELPEEKIRNLQHWDRWTVKRFNEDLKKGVKRDWDAYVKGLLIHLQNYYRLEDGEFIKKIRGMDILVGGDLPARRGLSSSSALVTAIALVVREINDIKIPLGEFIDLIGFSEWFVMTRGACADHAAITLCKRGYVSHIGSQPTDVSKVTYAPFPEDYCVLIVGSGFERPQDEETRNFLRVTAASYEIAALLIKDFYPEYASKIKWLRDVSTRNLNVSLSKIYEILKSLPVKADRDNLRSLISEKHLNELEEIFSDHKAPKDGYNIRQVALYGLAEAERAHIFPRFLREGRIREILRLIKTSHDGDRVSKFASDGKRLPWDTGWSSSDERIDELLKMIDEGYLEEAQLYWQPGGFERSIPPIDHLCDIVDYFMEGEAEGQIIGAGLGGDVLILARKRDVNKLREILREKYFRFYGVKEEITIVSPGQRASIFKL